MTVSSLITQMQPNTFCAADMRDLGYPLVKKMHE